MRQARGLPGIFISYRRDDSAGFAGRLYDRLAERFGGDRVFMDIDTIHPGHEFAADIERALSECDACIVLIGRQWESIALPDGRRRLEDPTDFVRLEVAAAIRRGISVFPVLVEGAKPPAAASLPEDIRPIAGRQAIELTSERWNYDVGRLILALDEVAGGRPPERQAPKRASSRWTERPKLIAGVTLAFVIAIVGGWLISHRSETPAASALEACPTSPTPSLPPSTIAHLDGPTTYVVHLTPTCQTGQPGSSNKVWTGDVLGTVGDDWKPEVWKFSPNGQVVRWTGAGRPVSATLALQDGIYAGTDTTGSPGGCNRNPDAKRDLYLSTSSADAATFEGWLKISWYCDSYFEVRFQLTGTKA